MNLAHHLASPLKSVAIHRYTTSIILGGLITHIAVTTVGFVEANHVSALGCNLLDLTYFASLHRLYAEQ